MNDENLKPFKKGQSGNILGKPKGTRHLSTLLKEILSEEIEVTEGDSKIKRPFSEVIVRNLIKKAHDGDIRAIQEIFDRLEGKATQVIEEAGNVKFTVRWKPAQNLDSD